MPTTMARIREAFEAPADDVEVWLANEDGTGDITVNTLEVTI